MLLRLRTQKPLGLGRREGLHKVKALSPPLSQKDLRTMDPKKIKEELSRLRDADAPKEVVAAHEDLLAKKVKGAIGKGKKKWDKMNNCWVEDPEGPLEGADPCDPEESSVPTINITLNIGG